MFGLGKYVRLYKTFRKWKWLVPLYEKLNNAYRSGDMKKAIGSRKLKMVLLAQVMFAVVTVILAWFGVSEDMIENVLNMIFGALGIGVGGNISEHITDTIKAVKAAKAEESST